MTISGATLAAIRSRLDPVEVARWYGLDLKPDGSERLKARCPFHDEKTASFKIHKGGGFRCYGCGAGGDAIGLYQRLSGEDFPTAIRSIAVRLGVPIAVSGGHSEPGSGRSTTRTWQASTPPPAKLRHHELGEPSQAWEIRDREGRLFAIHCRSDLPDGTKTFRWWRNNSWSLDGSGSSDAPLYGCERLTGFDRSRPVFVCEGEKATDALLSVGLQALGTVTGSSATPSDQVLSVLRGFFVVLWPDSDDGGRRHMEKIGNTLAPVAKKTQLFVPDGLPEKGDAFDFVELRLQAEAIPQEIASELEKLAAGLPDWQNEENEESDEKTDRPTQAEILLGLAAGAELFHDRDQTAYATIATGQAEQTWPVKSRPFKLWLQRLFYQATEKAISSQALQGALDVLQARAIFDGDERPVHVRLAGTDETIYVDLCNEAWEGVEITADRWRVVSKPEAKFRRSKGMQSLPRPVGGGSLEELRPFLNAADDDSFILSCAFLVASLRPTGPYPILHFQGEQGSAKSTTSRVHRSLVDPSTAPLRTMPRDERDLMIAATNSWIVAYDNLSGLPKWVSDALCRLATGGGFSTRSLYTDGDETIFSAMRPAILNGIEDIASRQDLLDRSLILTLPAISKSARKEESDFWPAFKAKQPRILGALLDAVSCALRNIGLVKLPTLPRMADFAAWVVAAEPALPWEPGAFMRAYLGNRDDAVQVALESDVVATAVREFADETTSFGGTATELLNLLEQRVTEKVRTSRSWPKAPQVLSNRLRRAAPALRQLGIDVSFSKGTGRQRCRIIEIEKSADEASEASEASDDETQPADSWMLTDRRPEEDRTLADASSLDADAPRTLGSSAQVPEFPVSSDASDASDARNPDESTSTDGDLLL